VFLSSSNGLVSHPNRIFASQDFAPVRWLLYVPNIPAFSPRNASTRTTASDYRSQSNWSLSTLSTKFKIGMTPKER